MRCEGVGLDLARCLCNSNGDCPGSILSRHKKRGEEGGSRSVTFALRLFCRCPLSLGADDEYHGLRCYLVDVSATPRSLSVCAACSSRSARLLDSVMEEDPYPDTMSRWPQVCKLQVLSG